MIDERNNTQEIENFDHIRLLNLSKDILSDEKFSKSPVLANLLSYLVDATIQGIHLKSSTIAANVLGKQATETFDADTHARVNVRRLRKALDAYFAAHPDLEQIVIESGSYTVHLRPPRAHPEMESQSSASRDDQQIVAGIDGKRKAWFWQRRKFLAAGCFLLVLSAVALSSLYQNWQQETWQNIDFPTISIKFTDPDANPEAPPIDEGRYRDALQMALLDYAGFRLIESERETSDYVIRVRLRQHGNRLIESLYLFRRDSGRLLWGKDFAIANEADIARNASSAALQIVGMAGAITSFERRNNNSTETPNGCWLAFTQAAQELNTVTNTDLTECAQDWYQASEDHPIAAFLYGWTLIDQSATGVTFAERQARLAEARQVISSALAVNPEHPLLHAVQARAFAFAGDRELVVAAARDAIASAPNNRTIVGTAASLLVFWNQPEGREILKSLGN